jgi:hypothetical protein
MTVPPTTLSIAISSRVRPVLEGMAGETPDQKITNLLLGELRRNLEACDQELLDLEVKYGLEHKVFIQRLAAGRLGDEYGYDLELDAMRWHDLIAERKYWLKQLSQLKGQSG